MKHFLCHLYQVIFYTYQALICEWWASDNMDNLDNIFLASISFTSLTTRVKYWNAAYYTVRDSVRDGVKGERWGFVASPKLLTCSSVAESEPWVACRGKCMAMEKIFHSVQPCFCELGTLSADPSLTLHAIPHAISHALTCCVSLYYVWCERSEGYWRKNKCCP